jgi:hypothetical protein
MEIIKGIFIGVSLETIIIFTYVMCKTSSYYDRLEESQYNDENV